MRMDAPAIVFQCPHERGETTPRRHVWRSQRCLLFTHPIDQDLPVVHAAQDILRPLECPQLGSDRLIGNLGSHLEDIAKFFRGNPHVVQPVWKIDRAGTVCSLAQPSRTTYNSSIDRPAPGPRVPPGHPLGVFDLGARAIEPFVEFPEFLEGGAIEQPLARIVALSRNRGADEAEDGAMHAAGNMQLVNEDEHDIQFANASQPRGDLAKPACQALRRARLEL